MISNGTQRSLVVVMLGGGNDCLNTVIPYNDGLYYDNRPNLGIPQDQVVSLDDKLGFKPEMAPIKPIWDQGDMAIINGIGYPNPNRSHFRSLDIWHTAEPDKIGYEGWLGRAIRDLDPKSENVITGVNFGRGLPRALSCPGIPVASVGSLESYGLFTDSEDDLARQQLLDAFSQMYGGADGKGPVLDFIAQAGGNALKGADILKTAPLHYTSSVEYANTSLGQSLRDAARVMFADLGTRIFFTQLGAFDTHAGQLFQHSKLWNEVSPALADFTDDLKEHNRWDDTLILVWSEFGRRINDNGTGTDHGSGGVAFVLGGAVDGGFYGEYPSLREEDKLDGDLHFNNDFRSTYSTILERWLGLEAAPIVNGTFEQFDFIGR